MWHRKNQIVIAMTTNGTAPLHVSVPAVARLPGHFTLIIHNCNPEQPVCRRDIRKMGYRGQLHIINNETLNTPGLARFEIINAVPSHAKWIIFTNAGDVLVDVDITPAGDNNFTIIKNAISVRKFSDLMNAAYYGTIPSPDGNDTVLHQPSLRITGIPIRMDAVRGILTDDDTDIMVDDQAMWQAIREYTQQTMPTVTPIFMDTVSYIINDIDAAAAPRG